MRIALLFNARPAAAIEGAPDDEFEEYDSPGTVAAIARALSRFGAVEPLEADAGLARRLQEGRFDFAFNIAEGRGRRGRESHAAALCEMLGVPFTHSDAVTLGLTLDKMLARRVVSPDVRVAPAVLIDCVDDLPRSFELGFPVVVKPNDEGSSKGIRDDSVALDSDGARRLAAGLLERYRCPVLVEEYLSGAEVTVGVAGNGRDARVLRMMEIGPAGKTPYFLYSVDVKRAFRERVHYFTPPRLPHDTLSEIEANALAAYRLLGCRDIARIDFRLDARGRPHFLECNPLPGLDPDASDIVILARPTMTHAELVGGIFRDAMRRYGMLDP